jgi:hypothetical protein
MELTMAKATPGKEVGDEAEDLPSCLRLSAISAGNISQGNGVRGNNLAAVSQEPRLSPDVSFSW